jgi:hypothetical protein
VAVDKPDIRAAVGAAAGRLKPKSEGWPALAPDKLRSIRARPRPGQKECPPDKRETRCGEKGRETKRSARRANLLTGSKAAAIRALCSQDKERIVWGPRAKEWPKRRRQVVRQNAPAAVILRLLLDPIF